MAKEIKGIKSVSVTIEPLEKPICDVCGKEAANYAFDLTECNDGFTVWYERRGNPKYGCSEHAAVSRVYSIEGFYIKDF